MRSIDQACLQRDVELVPATLPFSIALNQLLSVHLLYFIWNLKRIYYASPTDCCSPDRCHARPRRPCTRAPKFQDRGGQYDCQAANGQSPTLQSPRDARVQPHRTTLYIDLRGTGTMREGGARGGGTIRTCAGGISRCLSGGHATIRTHRILSSPNGDFPDGSRKARS